MDIEKCILSIANGDIEALERLYSAVRVAVYGFVLSIVCDAVLAEDITQDAFIQIYNKAALYRAGTNPMAWVITIAKNLAYDTLRKGKKVCFMETKDKQETIGVEEQEDIKFSRCEIEEVLSKLPIDERKIVILKAVSGFTHSEIARMLNLSEGTVKWKYYRALKKLSETIGGEIYGT